jgi:fucose permease
VLEVVAAFAFLVFGVALVLPGAAQPALAMALDLDLAASGLVASALSLGLGVGVLLGGPLSDRVRGKPLFAAAAGLAACSGLALAGGGTFAAVLAATAGIGLGAGIYETFLNAAVVARAPESAASRLSLIHAFATLGAGLGAPILGLIASRHGFPGAYAVLGAAFAAIAASAVAIRVSLPGKDDRSREGPRGEGQRRPLTSLWGLAAVSFAYVGLETALSVFAAPHAEGLGLDPARGMRALSAFWVGLFVSRVGFAMLRRPARPGQLRLAGLAGGLALLATAFIPAFVPELGFLAVGLGLGIVFPLVVALAGEVWPARRATAVGLVVGAGSLGGFAVPWAAGMVGDIYGPASAVASLAVLAGGVAMFPGLRRP